MEDKYPKIAEKIKSSPNVLLLDFGFENCLAQIVVNEPTFAPYKYVSFEALDSKSTLQLDYIYVYYDSIMLIQVGMMKSKYRKCFQEKCHS